MILRWDEISPDDFEVVVAALLRAMGFENVTVRPLGADDGWDIDAQTVTRAPDGTVSMPTWRVECKRYKSKPSPQLIRDHLGRMIDADPKPHNILFVSTADFRRDLCNSLQRKGRRHEVAVHVWDRRPLERHVFDHLDDPRLRRLLIAHINVDLPMAVLEVAAKKQVLAEIESRVGRKYIRDLYQPRPAEWGIRQFLSWSPEKAQVTEFVEGLRSYAKKHLRDTVRDERKWKEILAEIIEMDSLEEAGPRIEALCKLTWRAEKVRRHANAVGAIRRNCLLVKDKAGSGKTNLFCRMAESLGPGGPIGVFLSCKFDLSEAHGLPRLIADALLPHIRAEMATAGGEPVMVGLEDLMDGLFLTLGNAGRELVVFLDGINENRDLAGMDSAALALFLGWNRYPVRFVVSCRDIFWSFFSQEQWQRFLHDGKALELPEFDEYEVDQAIPAYFRKFEVQGEVRGEARRKCRHPLLLRFFCEAHAKRDIRIVQDIRLKDLFEEYWKRKVEDISQGLEWARDGVMKIEEFVFRLAGWMSEQAKTQIQLRDVPLATSCSDLQTDRSIYRRLLDQDIIIEELPAADSLDTTYQARRVSFVYDEFYDYISALAHIQQNDWDESPVGEVCWDFGQVIARSEQFEQFRGVAEYLLLICEKRELHKSFGALLAKMGQYELLCNVLPKLQGATDWMPGVLRECVRTLGRQRQHVKTSPSDTGESPGILWDEIRVMTDADAVFSSLISAHELHLDEDA